MRNVLRALRPLLPGPWDLHVYGGAGLIVAGLWYVHPGVAMVVGGTFLLALGLARTKPWR